MAKNLDLTKTKKIERSLERNIRNKLKLLISKKKEKVVVEEKVEKPIITRNIKKKLCQILNR